MSGSQLRTPFSKPPVSAKEFSSEIERVAKRRRSKSKGKAERASETNSTFGSHESIESLANGDGNSKKMGKSQLKGLGTQRKKHPESPFAEKEQVEHLKFKSCLTECLKSTKEYNSFYGNEAEDSHSHWEDWNKMIEMQNSFECHCFIENERERSQRQRIRTSDGICVKRGKEGIVTSMFLNDKEERQIKMEAKFEKASGFLQKMFERHFKKESFEILRDLKGAKETRKTKMGSTGPENQRRKTPGGKMLKTQRGNPEESMKTILHWMKMSRERMKFIQKSTAFQNVRNRAKIQNIKRNSAFFLVKSLQRPFSRLVSSWIFQRMKLLPGNSKESPSLASIPGNSRKSSKLPNSQLLHFFFEKATRQRKLRAFDSLRLHHLQKVQREKHSREKQLLGMRLLLVSLENPVHKNKQNCFRALLEFCKCEELIEDTTLLIYQRAFFMRKLKRLFEVLKTNKESRETQRRNEELKRAKWFCLIKSLRGIERNRKADGLRNIKEKAHLIQRRQEVEIMMRQMHDWKEKKLERGSPHWDHGEESIGGDYLEENSRDIQSRTPFSEEELEESSLWPARNPQNTRITKGDPGCSWDGDSEITKDKRILPFFKGLLFIFSKLIQAKKETAFEVLKSNSALLNSCQKSQKEKVWRILSSLFKFSERCWVLKKSSFFQYLHSSSSFILFSFFA